MITFEEAQNVKPKRPPELLVGFDEAMDYKPESKVDPKLNQYANELSYVRELISKADMGGDTDSFQDLLSKEAELVRDIQERGGTARHREPTGIEQGQALETLAQTWAKPDESGESIGLGERAAKVFVNNLILEDIERARPSTAIAEGAAVMGDAASYIEGKEREAGGELSTWQKVKATPGLWWEMTKSMFGGSADRARQELKEAGRRTGQRGTATFDVPQAQGLAEAGVDVAAGLGAFLVRLWVADRVTKKLPIPDVKSLQQALAWELVNTQGKPGEGALMSGALGALGKLKGDKALQQWLVTGGQSTAMGGLVLAQGGEIEDAIIAAAVPVVFQGYAQIRRAYSQKLQGAKDAKERARIVEELKDQYRETLGVRKNATPQEIQKAYRQKVKELHPDIALRGQKVTPEQRAQAEMRFQEAVKAYEGLYHDKIDISPTATRAQQPPKPQKPDSSSIQPRTARLEKKPTPTPPPPAEAVKTPVAAPKVEAKPEAPPAKVEAKPPVVKDAPTIREPQKVETPVAFPLKRVEDAYSHISHSPRNAAIVEQQQFERVVSGLRSELNEHVADKGGEFIDEAIQKFESDYVKNREAVWRARESTVSSAVAGRSRFDSRQAERRNSGIERAEQNFSKWLTSAMAKLRDKTGVSEKMRKIEMAAEDQKEQAKKKAVEIIVQRFAALKAGDKIDVGGNAPAIIAKKNRFSVITDGGSKYTIRELYGIGHDQAKAVLSAMSEPAPVVAKDAPAPRKSVIEEIDRAVAEGRTDAGTAAIAHQLVRGVPDIDANTSIEFSTKIRRATTAMAKAEGLPTHDEDGKRIDYLVTGETTSNLGEAATQTAIKLYKGHDADTVVEEWYHRSWDRLPEADKQRFGKYHESTGDNRSPQEHFAQEGRDFFFSEKMHRPAGAIRALFAKSRNSLRALIDRIRNIRGANIPKKIQEMYRKAVKGEGQVRAEGDAQQMRPDDARRMHESKSAQSRKAELDKLKTGIKVRDQVLSAERRRLAKVIEKMGGQVRAAELDTLEAAMKARQSGFMAGRSAQVVTAKEMAHELMRLPLEVRGKLTRALAGVKTDKQAQEFMQKIEKVSAEYYRMQARDALDKTISEVSKNRKRWGHYDKEIEKSLEDAKEARSGDIESITIAAQELQWLYNQASESQQVKLAGRMAMVEDVAKDMAAHAKKWLKPLEHDTAESPEMSVVGKAKMALSDLQTLSERFGPKFYDMVVTHARTSENQARDFTKARFDELREAIQNALPKGRNNAILSMAEKLIFGNVIPKEIHDAKKQSPFLKGNRRGVETTPFTTVSGDTVHLSMMERVGLAGNLSDPDTRSKLHHPDNEGWMFGENDSHKPVKWKPADTESLFMSLTEPEKEMLRFFVGQYSSGPIKEALDEGGRLNLGGPVSRQGIHWPMSVSLAKSQRMLSEMFSRDRKALENLGILQTRIPHTNPIKIWDAVQTYTQHVRKVAALRYFGEWSRNVSILLGNPQAGDVVRNHGGKEMVEAFETYRKAMIGGLRSPQNWPSKLLSKMMNRTARAMVAVNPNTYLKNHLSIMAAWCDVPMNGELFRASDIANAPQYFKRAAEIYGQSSYFQSRLESMDYTTGLIGGSEVLGDETITHRLSRRQIIGILGGEKNVGTYEIALCLAQGTRLGLKGKALTDYALERAEETGRNTQNPSSVVDAPLILLHARENPLIRAMTMFMSQQMKCVNIIGRLRAAYKQGRIKRGEYYTRLAVITIVMGTTTAITERFLRRLRRGLTPTDKEELRKELSKGDAKKDWAGELLWDVAEGVSYPLMGDRLVRGAGAMYEGYSWRSTAEELAGPMGTTVGGAVDGFKRAVISAGKYLDSMNEKDKKASADSVKKGLMRMGRDVATLMGIPVAPISRYIEGGIAGIQEQSDPKRKIRDLVLKTNRGEVHPNIASREAESIMDGGASEYFKELRKVAKRQWDRTLNAARKGNVEKASEYMSFFVKLEGDPTARFTKLENESPETMKTLEAALDKTVWNWRESDTWLNNQVDQAIKQVASGELDRESLRDRLDVIGEAVGMDQTKRYRNRIRAYGSNLTTKARKSAIEGDMDTLKENLKNRRNLRLGANPVIESIRRSYKDGKISTDQARKAIDRVQKAWMEIE